MLKTLDKIQRAKVFKNLNHQFIFLIKKMRNGYQNCSNLVKQIWKDTTIAKDAITSIIKRFGLYVNVNKEKRVFYNKMLIAIDKYWQNIRFYKRFY